MVRRRSGEDDQKSSAVSERNLYRLVAVSFGLLCLLQVSLNVSLRLILYNKYKSTLEMQLVQLQTSYNNLTVEKDQLQTSYLNLMEKQDQVQRKSENITKERNDLQKELQVLNSQGCVYFGSSFYYISSVPKTWQQSREDCLQRGADLIIINSDEEQEFAKGFKKRLWIGLTDQELQGTWKWVDGTPLTIRYWMPSEPNNARGNEDCAEIKNYNMPQSWNDDQCNQNKICICEKKLPA